MFPCLVILVAGVPAPTPNIEKSLYNALKNDGVVIIPGTNLILAAKAVEQKKLLKLVIVKRDAGGEVQWVTQCEFGEIRVDAMRRRLLILMSRRVNRDY